MGYLIDDKFLTGKNEAHDSLFFYLFLFSCSLSILYTNPLCFMSAITGGSRSTVVTRLTADQQTERSILHLGHDSY